MKTRLRHLYIAPRESGNCVETLPESTHASTIIDRDRIIIMEGRQSTRDASPAKENAGLAKFYIKFNFKIVQVQFCFSLMFCRAANARDNQMHCESTRGIAITNYKDFFSPIVKKNHALRLQ